VRDDLSHAQEPPRATPLQPHPIRKKPHNTHFPRRNCSFVYGASRGDAAMQEKNVAAHDGIFPVPVCILKDLEQFLRI